ncbi:MAG: AAA family ATPase [bacterium]|nr:AAA family ATPase [bacterium]
MEKEAHRLNSPTPSDVPSLETLKPEASAENEASSGESIDNPENVTEAQPTPDPINQLVDSRAEIRDINRALALDWSTIQTQTESKEDTPTISPSARIHSVEVKGQQKYGQFEERLETLATDQALKKQASSNRPHWEEHFPKPDEPTSQADYTEFLAQFPIGMQVNIEALRAVTTRQKELLEDPQVQERWHQYGGEIRKVLESASMIRGTEKRQEQIAQDIMELHATARRNGRELTTAEKKYITDRENAIIELRHDTELYQNDPKIVEELRRRDAIDDARELKTGVLETPIIAEITETRVPLLLLGKPLLLKGETGGAKTVLAKHISQQYFGVEPDVISGKDDMNSYILMGKTGLKVKEGATETVFLPGPLTRAMIEGQPVIIDEIDQMRTEDISGLNYILQLRPGDSFTIQEDTGEIVVIKEGFCVIATANMKSDVSPTRYQRNVIDTATHQRFRNGAGEVRVRYPDYDQPEGEFPAENMRLVTAALTDVYGNVALPAGMTVPEVVNLVKVAHATQRMFSMPATVAGASFVDSQTVTQGRAALEQAVLAPREVLGILSQVRDTNGRLSFTSALTQFVSEQELPSDRVVLAKLLASHDLLPHVNEDELRVPPGTLTGFRR